MNKAHQIQLNPTELQKILLHKSFGCKRHSYNWALSKWQELYKTGEKPSAMSLIKLQNNIKKKEMPFYKEVNKCAVQYAISDASFGEVSRQLVYKCLWSGVELVKADRYFASSKTCSNCGCKKETLKLSERTFRCENCGFQKDRDFNAAINLANYSPTDKQSESYACGDFNAVGENRFRKSKKQEILNDYESNKKH